MRFGEFKKLFSLSLILVIFTTVSADAVIEKATINQTVADLARGPVLVENQVFVFGQNGVSFINPTAGSDISTGINLQRDAAGNLIWNNNSFLDTNNNFSGTAANVSGTITAPSFIGNLNGTADRATATLALDPNVNLDLTNQVTGVLPVANGGTGTTTSTGTGNVVLSNNPNITGNLNLSGGGLKLGSSAACTPAGEGKISYDAVNRRVQLCTQGEFIDPSGSPFEFDRVFITSNEFNKNLVAASGNASPNGVLAADKICQNAAKNAGLGTSWIAIISGTITPLNSNAGTPNSTVTINAIDRVPPEINLRLIDGTIISTTDIWDGAIDSPINIDENGNRVNIRTGSDLIWTGTQTDGTINGTCGNWEGGNNAAQDGVSYGLVSQSTGGWIDLPNAVANCGSLGTTSAHLYCVEINKGLLQNVF